MVQQKVKVNLVMMLLEMKIFQKQVVVDDQILDLYQLDMNQMENLELLEEIVRVVILTDLIRLQLKLVQWEPL